MCGWGGGWVGVFEGGGSVASDLYVNVDCLDLCMTVWFLGCLLMVGIQALDLCVAIRLSVF